MNFSDPIIWACIAAIVFGFVFFIWAIGRFRTHSTSNDDGLAEALANSDSLGPIDLGTPPEKPFAPSPRFASPTPAPAMPSSVLTPSFSKEVSDRLESMTQRLEEMQSVLSKQTSAVGVAGGAAPAGGIGQGMSPETIERLLKIIGSVVQQVDVLQKSLNVSPSPASTAKPASGIGSAAASPFTPLPPKA